MEKCKIYNKEKKGTGIICKINDELIIMITNIHILNGKDIEENKISINNKVKEIKMDEKRKKYTNEIMDVTIIEINKEKYGINNYLEKDEEDINDKENNIEIE